MTRVLLVTVGGSVEAILDAVRGYQQEEVIFLVLICDITC